MNMGAVQLEHVNNSIIQFEWLIFNFPVIHVGPVIRWQLVQGVSHSCKWRQPRGSNNRIRWCRKHLTCCRYFKGDTVRSVTLPKMRERKHLNWINAEVIKKACGLCYVQLIWHVFIFWKFPPEFWCKKGKIPEVKLLEYFKASKMLEWRF